MRSNTDKSPHVPPSPTDDLAIEANHRIANNLNALAAMLRKKIGTMAVGPKTMPRDEAVAALTEMTANIFAVSRLHQRLTALPTGGRVDLHTTLTDILQEFQASGLCSDRLCIRTTLGGACMVEAAHASTLALAFSEIVTNAIKYAHPTGLPVELSVANVATELGGTVLQISDDGVGFPEGFVEERDAGIGLRLVRSLIESVGCRLDIKSDPLGLVFSIHLPPGMQSRLDG